MGWPDPGSTSSLPAGGPRATQHSSRAHAEPELNRRRHRPRRSNSWCGSAARSPARAWTPEPTRSAGTCASTIASHCRGRRSTGSCAAPSSSQRNQRSDRSSSYIRFEADLPNETWQADFTHWRLADDTNVEILCFIDDHSRYAISVTAHHRVTGPIVVNTFTAAVETHGIPTSTLTDNGMVFTARFAGGKGGRNGFETLLDTLGVDQKNSRPNHPTTCGKVERFHQTLKRWLRARPAAATTVELQHLLDAFVDEYNHRRPHRSLHGRTPAAAYQARPKATAGGTHTPHRRVRSDRINTGNVTVRINGQLHHIGLGRHLDRTPVLLLIDDLDVRVIHATTGEILRPLTINPNRRYHGTGAQHGGPSRPYGPYGPRKTTTRT